MGYEYPDVREAFWQLTEEPLTDANIAVTPYFHLTVDWTPPAVQLSLLTGVEGFLERVDRMGVDFYAEGEAAGQLADAFKVRVCGENLTVPGVGLLDVVVAETVPHDVPYPSDRINVSSAVYRVTTRPKF